MSSPTQWTPALSRRPTSLARGPETELLAVGDDPAAASLDLVEFDVVYDKWFDRVASWVRALGAPDADRDDLVQDVFLTVHRRLPDFDGANLPGWLYQIARRRVRDYRRLLWIRRLFAHSVPLSDDLSNTGPGPADELETKRKARQLAKMLGVLNPDQRAAFVLLEIEGYSGKEIARLQGVPINTVWARIHNARKKLNLEMHKQSQARPRSAR